MFVYMKQIDLKLTSIRTSEDCLKDKEKEDPDETQSFITVKLAIIHRACSISWFLWLQNFLREPCFSWSIKQHCIL